MAEEDHVMREIDDELRQERLKSFWSNFGSYIIAASAVIVLGTVGVTGWQNYSQSQSETATAALMELIEKQESAYRVENVDDFLTFNKGNEPLQELAHISALRLLLEAEEDEKARQTAATLLESNKLKSPIFHDYAALVANTHETLEAALTTGRPFTHTAMELHAMQLLAKGKEEEASKLLKQLAEDALTPTSIRKRAMELLPGLTPTEEAPDGE